ncbi:shikimate 5-dehydrogenase [Sulfodiicoccus acidiphilus]|uniref:Shikimate 5-dehydrogenase n=1 Tax=Sulfodiicoccus acidiphilus TaxID=1670455 RepID=A0A348B108_9CREN|nr:shikimate dehydrogenase [Sulfodiicoccus acidiphilus]BBD71860.1 shikimate 5-dehydrogenase [Sulfodiicoccus acidiphilus]GGU02496.1 shikimate 5-dehydrogenase [Sulfodiicoccus acidiphilus]
MFGVRTKLLGVLGSGISYTLSPAIHNFSFSQMGIDAVYLVFDVQPDDLHDVVEGLKKIAYGFNVTVPYKEEVASMVSCEGESKGLGVVNTVHSGKGYNTDYIALSRLLNETGLEFHEAECAIFGAGGAAAASALSLGRLGCKVKLINRSLERAIRLKRKLDNLGVESSVASDCGEPQVVVNATPRPELVPTSCVRGKLAIDFVYTPVRTSFITLAESRGMTIIDGLSILIEQALEAEKIWFGRSLSRDEVRRFLYDRKFVR